MTQGNNVSFTYTGSENYCPQTYYWDFGDGTTSTEKNPIHKYETIGTFTVSITIIDRDGDFDTKTKINYIEVTQ
ncbi:MAG: PKD domain-containing protein [Candidatus Thorarchaeota archaeon]